VTLLAFAAERRAAGRPPLLIDISRPLGPQQKTHSMPRLWRNMGQAERRTDRRTPNRYTDPAAYNVSSVDFGMFCHCCLHTIN